MGVLPIRESGGGVYMCMCMCVYVSVSAHHASSQCDVLGEGKGLGNRLGVSYINVWLCNVIVIMLNYVMLCLLPDPFLYVIF